MLYHLYDLQHALLTPARIMAETSRFIYQNPWNPIAHTPAGRTLGAGAEMISRLTRRFGKPEFGLHETMIDGKTIKISEKTILEKPFCTLTRFYRHARRNDPKVLVVAPMSGHFSTLLRGTVEALLPHHDVYITEWIDARQVSLTEGRFNLDDYIEYVMEFIQELGPDVHVVAVCQPAVPVLVATALMASMNDPKQPATITLMGGPIDTRISKTAVTELAEERPLSWFENTVVTTVPCYYPGGFRKVYPGFLQLSGFMSMNLDRHVGKYMDFFNHLVQGDGDSAEAHRKFYNEYLAVMDITAEFYLQTVETVFQRHLLPRNKMKWRNPKTGVLHDVVPADIKKTALLTIEGELDDISAHGQTTAAHPLCTNLAPEKQFHHFQENVGHYGIFNGRRWQQEIMPRMRTFMRQHDAKADPVPDADLKASPALRPEQWDEKKHSLQAVLARKKAKEKVQKFPRAVDSSPMVDAAE
ncbi:MAG: polyhydroxyalkanoate depolymerase [Rhodospirillales bacterium]|nr:polyhydroxyalkanoate depolymerase [Rhodospirillales bacterium]MCB9965256.1 polyhydroxyalkanoate depolymerase [Rhodospirillales bacterium]MCB9972974.1 polyhydroxyalkanoate depolymerase [Rhodospirillales bacterium]MCB9980038.1 polyhydroxyalkanoate depolymerase [Rhodospirillales bacterium]